MNTFPLDILPSVGTKYTNLILEVGEFKKILIQVAELKSHLPFLENDLISLIWEAALEYYGIFFLSISFLQGAPPPRISRRVLPGIPVKVLTR